jgi:hypothetical protein
LLAAYRLLGTLTDISWASRYPGIRLKNAACFADVHRALRTRLGGSVAVNASPAVRPLFVLRPLAKTCWIRGLQRPILSHHPSISRAAVAATAAALLGLSRVRLRAHCIIIDVTAATGAADGIRVSPDNAQRHHGSAVRVAQSVRMPAMCGARRARRGATPQQRAADAIIRNSLSTRLSGATAHSTQSDHPLALGRVCAWLQVRASAGLGAHGRDAVRAPLGSR